MIKHVTTICMLAIAALAFSGMTSAADGSSSAKQQQAQKLMQQYRQKAQKLQSIHEKAIQNNSDLAAEQKQFESQVKDAVEDNGYSVDKGQARVKDMTKKLKSDKLSDAERKAVIKDFQAERQQMAKARDKALQDPAIQKAGKKLQDDTIAAMKKEDPQTPQLLKQMESLRDQLRQSMPAPAAKAPSDG